MAVFSWMISEKTRVPSVGDQYVTRPQPEARPAARTLLSALRMVGLTLLMREV